MIVYGRKALREALGGCSNKWLQSMVAAGAPIRILHEGKGTRYVAEVEAVLAWIRVTSHHFATPEGAKAPPE